MLYAVVTPPAAEPLSTADLKAHLRILHDTEDALIAGFALAARSHIEETTGTSIINRTLDYWLPAWPARGRIELPFGPLVSVSGVYYLDEDGVEQTLSPTLYDVVSQAFFGRIERKAGATWPALLESSTSVRVRYVAGFGASGATVPPGLLHAIKLLTEHYYYRRGATSETRAEPVPMAVGALTGPFMRIGLG